MGKPTRAGVDSVKSSREAALEQEFQRRVNRKNGEDFMDRITYCRKCGKRMVPVITVAGRTDLQCISCDDPAVKWSESPLTAPMDDKPSVPEAA